MIVVFVHGWSVTHTDTYGGLPEALAFKAGQAGLTLDLRQVWLGRYVSFDDNVTMQDVVTGLDKALRDVLAPNGGDLPEFSCITHSTGGPVMREWLQTRFGDAGLAGSPLRHLVMLAPANHGSPLALLGKERVGRIKAFFSGVEPGEKILQWLSLGSDAQWKLSRSWLDKDAAAHGLFPFVLTGQTIDTKFYDFLNSYLVEVGSDGVVRSACANLNYQMLELRQTADTVVNTRLSPRQAFALALAGDIRAPAPTGFGVVPDASHSGTSIGIMNSVKAANADAKPVVAEILKCLGVKNAAGYAARCAEMEILTQTTQAADTRSKGRRYANLVFRIRDDHGHAVEDFDLYLLGGPTFDPAKLPKGFFIDRQRNAETPNCLVYYLDYDAMAKLGDQQFGVRVVGRPNKGLACYFPVEFRTDGATLAQILKPSQTVYVDIVLTRHVHDNVFRFDSATKPRQSFKNVTGYP
jgi:hypothetical protein